MKTRVLVVDDDEEDFLIIQHYLFKIKNEEYHVDWCKDYDVAVNQILENNHDIYLIDFFLGKGEGIEIIETVRRQNFIKPIILLTGAGSRKLDQKALEKGASDFIDKNELRSDTVERALRYALERYHQQRYIRDQERKYRSLFELSLEPFFILDEALNVTEWNAAFLEMFGQFSTTKNQLKGISFRSLFKNSEDYEAFIDKLKNDGFVKSFKTKLNNNERDILCFLSISQLPKMGEKKERGYHVALNDLTKFMEQEAEIKKLDKLMMSGRMARMIAHEVRNPLTNIRLAIEELEEIENASKDDDTIALQKMIERNAQRIALLIEELLKSARPMELEKSTSDLIDIVNDAIDICQDRIELQNVKLTKKLPNLPCIGSWDVEKLAIAFVNIITNAIEAMEGITSPQLAIYLFQNDASFVLQIDDNGKGMDADTKSNLFDPLFTNRKGGLGLGMTTTLNVISMHEGTINVNSIENQGTEITVVLPR